MQDNTTNDNILSFPKKNSNTSNKGSNPFLLEPPAAAQHTDSYGMTAVNYSHAPLKQVSDILNASKRNKKFGAVFSVGIITELDKSPNGPAVIPQMPAQFFDADELVALRARLIFELDKAIELAKVQASDPALYEEYEQEYVDMLTKGKRK